MRLLLLSALLFCFSACTSSSNLVERRVNATVTVGEINVEGQGILAINFESPSVNITYPEMALRYGIFGNVKVLVELDEKGQVIDAEVIQGIGGGCDEAALKALSEASYQPIKGEDGVDMSGQMSVWVHFMV